MGLAFGSGVHSLAWTANRPGAHTARGTLSYLWNQIENGVGSPTGMAYSSIPSLRSVTAIRDHWEDRVLAEGYDARPIPILRSVHLSFGLHFLERLARVSEGIDT
jgi:putative acyl-CoA dehydrogenase